MNVCIVVVTHNRIEYTKKTITSLLKDKTEEFDLYLWDNASADDTPDYLKSLKDNRITEVILSKENVGQTGAMNYAWSKTKAELVGKVDNDCVQTPGWTRVFARAHADIPKLGAVAAWLFFEEDFIYDVAQKKVQSFGEHQIFRHPWVGGSGFIMKRETYIKQGPWDKGIDVGTTDYFMKMALAGYINGWYYPFVYQDHLDDPLSECSNQLNDETLNSVYDITFTLRNKRIDSRQKSLEWRKRVLANLMYDPWDAKYYVGLRGKIWRARQKAAEFFALR
jgi:glycosyltransferase involved in cell wall biosynthesis